MRLVLKITNGHTINTMNIKTDVLLRAKTQSRALTSQRVIQCNSNVI